MKLRKAPKPANDTRQADHDLFGGKFGPLLSTDIDRIERLPEDLQDVGELLFALLTTSDLATSQKALARVRNVLFADPPVQQSIHERRMRVIALVKARTWKPEIGSLLRRIDPAFRGIKREFFRANAEERSDHRFAALLSCKCGAFNDRKIEDAKKAYERASRETSRRPRSRSK